MFLYRGKERLKRDIVISKLQNLPILLHYFDDFVTIVNEIFRKS